MRSSYLARKPNFFILGAPKCGTTSIADWLSDHPNVFMAPDKEPHFFNSDYVVNKPRNFQNYEKLFEGARENHIVVSEASTGYFFSDVAIDNILSYSPDARFLVMLRNPLEMVVSLHGQRVFEGYESEKEFARAWRLQPDRAKGNYIPRRCVDGKLLLYGNICLLASHLRRIYDKAGTKRTLTLFLDDVRFNPQKEYRRILNFLDIPDDGRTNFSAKNIAGKPRIKLIHEALIEFRRIRHRFNLPRPRTGFLSKIKDINKVHVTNSPIDEHLMDELVNYFYADIVQLESLVGQSLTHWLPSEYQDAERLV